MLRPPRLAATAALSMAAALAVAACGSEGDPSALESPAATASAPATPDATPTPSAASPTPTATPTPTPRSPGQVATPRLAGTVVTGLRSPWGVAFLPDGSALVTERDTARLLRVRGGEVDEVATVGGVAFGGEGGLLGVAVSPSFSDDRLVYLYATSPSGNRVLRGALRQGRLVGTEVVIDGIPASAIHNGGQLGFGPDGMLYVSTGDAADTSLSQRPDSLGGKILRVTPEGAVPDGNPEAGSPVWSSGHRNVQGLAWDDEGHLWASEFGANTWDELNRIEPGGNYGWPVVEGRGGRDAGFVDPRVQWPTDQASPSGVAFADGTVFMAALRGQRLWGIPVGGGRTAEPVAFFTGELGRLRAVAAAPDGSLWLVTNNTDGRGVPREGDDRILRLEVG